MPALEIVHIKPKPGAVERLLEIRPAVISEHLRLYPDVKAVLARKDDGVWIDVWTWKTKALADEALADSSFSPAFQEWTTLVDFISAEWSEIIEIS